MIEYIKREDVIEAIASGDPTDGWENIFCGRALIGMITKIPAADVVERKKGEWETIPFKCGSFMLYMPYCSLCGARPTEIGWEYRPNYCPNCGADMRGEDDV